MPCPSASHLGSANGKLPAEEDRQAEGLGCLFPSSLLLGCGLAVPLRTPAALFLPTTISCWSLNLACPFLVDLSLNIPWLQEPDLQLRTLTHTELVSHRLRVVEVSLGSTTGSRPSLRSVPGKTYKPASLRLANSWPRVSLQEITQAPVEGNVSYLPHLSASMPDGSASNQRLTLPHNLIQGNASAKKMLYDRKQKVRPP